MERDDLMTETNDITKFLFTTSTTLVFGTFYGNGTVNSIAATLGSIQYGELANTKMLMELCG